MKWIPLQSFGIAHQESYVRASDSMTFGWIIQHHESEPYSCFYSDGKTVASDQRETAEHAREWVLQMVAKYVQ